MNDIHIDELNQLEEHIRDQIDDATEERRRLRAIRRAAAINVVTLARSHAGRQEEMYSQSDADVIMAIMELLDRVAGLT